VMMTLKLIVGEESNRKLLKAYIHTLEIIIERETKREKICLLF
jgi:hypothetical protein